MCLEKTFKKTKPVSGSSKLKLELKSGCLNTVISNSLWEGSPTHSPPSVDALHYHLSSASFLPPATPSWSVEKFSSTKLVPGAKKLGDHCSIVLVFFAVKVP